MWSTGEKHNSFNNTKHYKITFAVGRLYDGKRGAAHRTAAWRRVALRWRDIRVIVAQIMVMAGMSLATRVACNDNKGAALYTRSGE